MNIDRELRLIKGDLPLTDGQRRRNLHHTLRKIRNLSTGSPAEQSPSEPEVTEQLRNRTRRSDFKKKPPTRLIDRPLRKWRDVTGKSWFKSARQLALLWDFWKRTIYAHLAPIFYYPLLRNLSRNSSSGAYELPFPGSIHPKGLRHIFRTAHSQLRARPGMEALFKNVESAFNDSNDHKKTVIRHFAKLESARDALRRNPTSNMPRHSKAYETLARNSPRRIARFSRVMERPIPSHSTWKRIVTANRRVPKRVR